MSKIERVVTLGQADPDAIAPRYRRKWVAIEVLEEPSQTGVTGRVIAHGPKSAKQKVVTELVRFRESFPEKQVALLYTGPMIKRGQDVILGRR